MDPGARQTTVEWREWGPEAFEESRTEAKPIMLALVTRWSPECREMDETTFSEPRIGANINDRFVPVRIDADRHPRVRERYTMGGFPSTIFLTPTGNILTGGTFFGVAGFRNILETVRASWDESGESAGKVPRALRDPEPPGGSLDETIEAHMIEQLASTYDDEFGGWGRDVKWPFPRTIEFALVRLPEQATRTLEAIRTHLYDTYDGGFYRFAQERNWREARRTKLAGDNAALIRAFAHGYRYTGESGYRETAEGAAEYLQTTLWTGETFANSQGGHEEYFRLEPAEREDSDGPAIDRTPFADTNGLVIDALLTLARYTDDEAAIRYARRAREFVVDELVEDGRVSHYDDSAAASDAKGDYGGEAVSGLLVDQARVLRALTTSWSVLGEAGPAREVADWTVEHLQDDNGAFIDGPTAEQSSNSTPDSAAEAVTNSATDLAADATAHPMANLGLLDRPLYPLDTAVECADALVDLAYLTGEHTYRQRARAAIEAFAGAADRMGVAVAHYATVSARLNSPQAIYVGSEAGSDLHRAALRLADHETIVVPDATAERLAEAVTPHGPSTPSGVARVVTNDDLAGEASTPEELESVLTDAGP